MSLATIGLALMAGMLSTLSPCVLPLLPILLTTAASEHRLAPVALAVGLGLSFTIIGLFVGTVGIGLGLDGELVRQIAAVLLIGLGCVLALPVMQERVAVAAGPAAVGSIAGAVVGEIMLGNHLYGDVRGAQVLLVPPGAPAHQAGLEPDDVIVGVDSANVRSVDDLMARIERAAVQYRLKIVRNGYPGWVRVSR